MIHPTAIISSGAEVHETAAIGAYSIIEGPVKIGENCTILSHAHILGDTTIGENCTIGRAAIIGENPQDLAFNPETSSGVRIGANNTIRELVTIHRGSGDDAFTTIGDHNFLMAGSHFAHDVQVGDHNVIANNCLLAGHIHVGNYVFLGGGSVFHQFIRLGDYCLSQGNSAVSKDIPPFCVVSQLNNLAGLNVIGMRRAGIGAEERASVKHAYNLIFRGKHHFTAALEETDSIEWAEPAQRLLDFLREKGKKGVCFPG